MLGDKAIACCLPPTCVLCGGQGFGGLDLCAGCLTDLPRNLSACPRCAIPLAERQPDGWNCGACQHQPPPQTSSCVPFLYRYPIPALVVGAKFAGRLNMARLLGQCLAHSLLESGAAWPELLIPVPLHPLRLRDRGYNQALEIARPLAKILGIPVDADVCVRSRAFTPQEGLDRAKRRANVRGAFKVGGPIRARHIAVIDDVVTTGSTTAELARVLLHAGADRIDIWGVARTPMEANPQGSRVIC